MVTEWTWKRWQWKGTLHSPKLQHYWNLTIRSFLFGGGILPLCRKAVGVFYSPSQLDKSDLRNDGNKGVLHTPYFTPYSPHFLSYQQIQLSDILKKQLIYINDCCSKSYVSPIKKKNVAEHFYCGRTLPEEKTELNFLVLKEVIICCQWRLRIYIYIIRGEYPVGRSIQFECSMPTAFDV